MKKFYTLVSTEKCAGGYNILLDSRILKTQDKLDLLAPNEDIANRVVREWADQSDFIVPDTMPFTQILSTKIDRIAQDRDAITQVLLKYVDTDLLCYLASAPDGLVHAQNKKWACWRSWFEGEFGVEPLETTTGLDALKQEQAIHQSIAHYIEGLADDHFTVFQLVASMSGSLLLSMAFTAGKARSDEVFEAMYVEEHFKDTLYNAEKYGVDPIAEKKQKEDKDNLQAYEDYLSSLR